MFSDRWHSFLDKGRKEADVTRQNVPEIEVNRNFQQKAIASPPD